MANEPHYPKDAVVENNAGSTPEATSAAPARKKTYVKTGVAVGIGSAAIVAALLYANRGQKRDR